MKSCKFIPPKRLGTIKVASRQKDRCWNVCGRQSRLASDKIVDIAVVKGQSNGIRWQRTGDEVANKYP